MAPSKLKPVDVVVVGSGVAGSIMAMELANAGLEVVCLERGRKFEESDFVKPYVHDELRFERHSDIFQDLSRETLTFRNHGQQDALPMRELGSFKIGEMVGGAAVHWGGNARRFLPHDFELRSNIVTRYGEKFIPEDCTIQDWGITWDDIEPYYDQFETIYGVGGKAGNIDGVIQPGGNPHEGPRYREFPNPPTERSYVGSIFADAASSLGYVPFQGPAATMTQDYKNLYRQQLLQCQRGGYCTSHVCAEGAKASPLNAVLPALYAQKTFEMRPQCNVVKVNMDSTGKKATGVTYIDAAGREFEQPADIVVLASYCFSNVRLLLLSGIGKPYDPISGTGVVGRNYAYQAGGRVQVFFKDREFNPFIGGGTCNTSIDEFNGDVIDRSGLGFVGGAYVNTLSHGTGAMKGKPVPDGTPRWGARWKQAVAQNFRRSLSIVVHGTCQTYRQNYLDLDPVYRDAYGLPLLRMTFDWHENEKKMTHWVTEQCVEIARAMGAAQIGTKGKGSHYSIVPYQGTHNVGGAVMGSDPSTSVVNKYLQSWDVHNLFVVGGSAFPQNAANGPTATIGMLACWAADAIKENYLQRAGSLV